MLLFIRVIAITLALVVICLFACIFSLLRPFSRNRVYHTSQYLSKVCTLIGLEVEVRVPDEVKILGPVVYVANHQSNLDMFTVSAAVQKNTVTVGKKSLKWFPFFGQMYWLTGNILIDRNNTDKAMGTIGQTVEKITEKGYSVWLFPEGTRSKGRGLLRFKTGAFRTALEAGVPVVPVCASNLHGAIQWNRWNNGKIIIELLPAMEITDSAKLRSFTNNVHDIMNQKVIELSEEAGTPMSVDNTTKNKD